MQVIHSQEDIHGFSHNHCKSNHSIGLVPTMGALHRGHLALVRKSLEDNDTTIVSIFVNPLQFNNEEDLKNYPRNLEEDLAILEDEGVNAAYVPSEETMYRQPPKVSIDFGELASNLEGKYRPGHFNGVGVVVAKLFHHCSPDRAYFGLKDLQQYLLIRKMAEDLSFPVEIIGHPIVREPSGLAMSSRNRRLSEEGLSVAATLYEGLKLAEQKWTDHSSLHETKSEVIDFYNSKKGLEIEYFQIVDTDSLEEVKNNGQNSIAFCVAGYVEGVRLIDNLYLR